MRKRFMQYGVEEIDVICLRSSLPKINLNATSFIGLNISASLIAIASISLLLLYVYYKVFKKLRQ